MAQMSRQVEEQQLVSPTWQRTCSHITRCSTSPDFQKNYSDSSPPICVTLNPVTFSYSLRWNYSWKGIILTQLRRSMHNHKRLSTHSHENFQEYMGNMLGSLYTYPRGLLQRRQWELGVTVINFFFMVKFPDVLGSTMYNADETDHFYNSLPDRTLT
jgi:hypothetical protein